MIPGAVPISMDRIWYDPGTEPRGDVKGFKALRDVLDRPKVISRGNVPGAPEPAPMALQGAATKSKMLSRKAQAKFMSTAIALELAGLNSPLKFKYLRTVKCAEEIRQEGIEIQSKYCGCRWCITCNRIRTSKLLEKYGQIIEQLKDPHFVTLTVRNIAPDTISGDVVNLKMYQREMFKHHRKTQDLLRKYGITVKGVRKYEAIPDKDLTGLRPHFHWLIDGTITEDQLRAVWYNQKLPGSWTVNGSKKYFENELRAGNLGMLKGEMLIQLWLKKHETISDRKGQHVTPLKNEVITESSAIDLSKKKLHDDDDHVNELKQSTVNAGMEVFKYTTKVMVKTRRDDEVIPLRMLDIIYRATERVRTISITGFISVQPRKPEIINRVENGRFFANLKVNWLRVNKMVSVFCPQEYVVNGPLLLAPSRKQINRITNYKRKYLEWLCYKEFTEILEKPITEDLDVQGYKDLTPQSTVFKWHHDNWYCVNTSQPLTIWQPTEKTAKFIEAFHYG